MSQAGGIVGAALVQSKVSPFRCERCGCGLICGPQELLLCSTCLPAEVVELRAKLAELSKMASAVRIAQAFSQRVNRGRIGGES